MLNLKDFYLSQSSKTKIFIRLVFFLSIILLHNYYVSDNPSNSPYLYFLYFSMIIFSLIYLIIINLIRKGLRFTSKIWIRDDIDGALDRSVKFSIKLNKFLYFSSSWIHILTFLIIYPLARHFDMNLFYTMLIVVGLYLEFFVRQLSLNWMWKNVKETSWKFSTYDQFILILKFLIIAPSLIILIYYFDYQIYNIDKDTFLKSKDPSGWGWYIFITFGFLYILNVIRIIYLSICHPKESFQITFDAIYDDYI